MKAVTWHGHRDVRVEDVPDPRLEAPTDAIVRITSSGICGSDLHLYEVLSMFMDEGDVLGHEPMGVVEEVGPEVRDIAPGDRVVIPFNIVCGDCFMCDRELYAQCDTRLYGSIPGGRRPRASRSRAARPSGAAPGRVSSGSTGGRSIRSR